MTIYEKIEDLIEKHNKATSDSGRLFYALAIKVLLSKHGFSNEDVNALTESLKTRSNKKGTA